MSHALLAHDDLMTAQLMRFFGPVHAVQTRVERDGDLVRRWSTLRQTATGEDLLQASLVISSANLPTGLLDRLLSGDRLFGGLLIEAGVAVQMTGRRYYQKPAEGSGALCWGRRQRMFRKDGNLHLCDIDECLSEEATLRRLLVNPPAGL